MIYYEYLVQFQTGIETVWSVDTRQAGDWMYDKDRTGTVITILRSISV
jgi:hypothetical protein